MVGHEIRGKVLNIYCRLQGTEIETKFFLDLEVPKSDRGVEIIILG
jgi:hypothetical protein